MVSYEHFLFTETNPGHFYNNQLSGKKKIINVSNLDRLQVISKVIHSFELKK